METYFDMHCHAGFTPDPRAFAEEAKDSCICALSCTVEPKEYVHLLHDLDQAEDCEQAKTSPLTVALGAHPWWIADGRLTENDIDTFCALAPTTNFIGEIGLDFSGERRSDASRAQQIHVLKRILNACNESTTKLISLHGTAAYTDLLNILDAVQSFTRHRIIFHWFSGTSDELQRALSRGAYFSVGPRMLTSRRGREYARQIPLERLLLETDMPARAGEPLPATIWKAELNNALTGISQLKNLEQADLITTLAATSAQLLSV